MKRVFLLLALACGVLISCKHDHSHEDGHDHDSEHGHEKEEGSLSPFAFTGYAEHTELFVEFSPLIKGEESVFTTHLTETNEVFNALQEAEVSLQLIQKGKKQEVRSDKASAPGIWRLSLKVEEAGAAELRFIVKTSGYRDIHVISDIPVYANRKEAGAANVEEKADAAELTFLKEQAWKTEFANQEVKKQAFSEVIRCSGRLIAAATDEYSLTASTKGLVSFNGRNLLSGQEVKANESLFVIQSNNLQGENSKSNYLIAESELKKASQDLSRAAELIKDQIISKKEYELAELNYARAQTNFQRLSKNYSEQGIRQIAPTAGYIQRLFVQEGMYVEEGTPLAMISRNRHIILQADVSQKYAAQMAGITSANFKLAGSDRVWNTDELKGKMSVSYNSGSALPYTRIQFEIDRPADLAAASVAEVFLLSESRSEAICVPITALMEEQGNYYVYVQTGGETFKKRPVQIGGRDGRLVELISGLTEGERVVTKGAYQIKLATASGTLPAHSHDH